ncbi:hypothetical protein LJR034_009051 [Caballeronia sp. LjRoot34]|uniref:hypothetical protein n=1 Tax=Caballeronia sp. LjRoot34 TaxID=3342325 RepID=UPI003ECE88CE
MLTLEDDGLEGFTQRDCDLLNQTVSFLTARGFTESHAADIACNNWRVGGEKTVESLAGFPLGAGVQRFQYRAYYEYNGPSRVSPFRTELSADEVDDTLSLFPQHLEHYLKPTAIVDASDYCPGSRSRLFSIVTGRSHEATNGAVASCLNRFDLYADLL